MILHFLEKPCKSKTLLKTIAHSKSTLTLYTLNEHILLIKRDFEISQNLGKLYFT